MKNTFRSLVLKIVKKKKILIDVNNKLQFQKMN